MKKIFLNESEKRKLISEKEKMIIESFAKTYNKIKRIYENEISTQPNYRNNSWNKQILKVGDKITVSNLPDVAPRGYENVKIGDTLSITNVRRNANGIVYDTDFSVDYGISNDDIQTLTNKFKHIGENEMGNTSELNPEDTILNFDKVFYEIFSIEPEYEYKETSRSNLSARYNRRPISKGATIATFIYKELAIYLKISIINDWDEDPDGATYDTFLRMSYEFSEGFDYIDNPELDYELTEPAYGDFVKFNNVELATSNLDIRFNKYETLIDSEFLNLLSNKTKEKLYNQIDALVEENRESQNFDDDRYY